MSKEKESFVLYRYLKYFWEKKVILFTVPFITALLFAAVYFMFFFEEEYIGKSSIYTGSINTNDVTNANNLVGEFDGKLVNEVEFSTTSYGYIDVLIRGEEKATVLEELDMVTKKINEDLIEKYDLRLKTTLENLKSLETNADNLQKSIDEYSNNIDSNDTYDEEKMNYYADALLWSLTEHSSVLETIKNMKNDIAFFEKPEVLYMNDSKSKNYIIESFLIGFILGLVITILFLILLRYIKEARAFFESNQPARN